MFVLYYNKTHLFLQGGCQMIRERTVFHIDVNSACKGDV